MLAVHAAHTVFEYPKRRNAKRSTNFYCIGERQRLKFTAVS